MGYKNLFSVLSPMFHLYPQSMDKIKTEVDFVF